MIDWPGGVAVDAGGNVFAAYLGTQNVLKFRAKGEFIAALIPYGQVGEPAGVAVDAAGNVFVVNTAEHAVLKFAPA